MAEEKNYYPFHEKAGVDAVVVYCSDPRFQEAFRLFLKKELSIEYYAPIVVPGSISSIGLELVMPKHLKTLKDQIEFMVTHGKSPRLILINHEDCKAYEKLHKIVAQLLRKKQADDLIKAAALFRKLIPSLANVSIYMARLDIEKPVNEGIYFEKLL